MSDDVRCRIRNQYFGYIVQDFALIEEDTSMQNILVPTLYSKHKKEFKGVSGNYQRHGGEIADCG